MRNKWWCILFLILNACFAKAQIGPKVIIAQKTGPDKIRKGSIARYDLTIQNIGNVTAKDVVIRDIIPAGMQYHNKKGPGVLRWDLGDLNPIN